MSMFPELHEIDYAPQVEQSSPVRAIRFRHDHLLFRPYSPKGLTKSGLWLERNPNHPRIWGWLLAISRQAREEYPALVPGVMLVVQRARGETIAKEEPIRVRYIGQKNPVIALALCDVQVAISPPLVAMEEAS